jgi:hypothetical protein
MLASNMLRPMRALVTVPSEIAAEVGRGPKTPAVAPDKAAPVATKRIGAGVPGVSNNVPMTGADVAPIMALPSGCP